MDKHPFSYHATSTIPAPPPPYNYQTIQKNNKYANPYYNNTPINIYNNNNNATKYNHNNYYTNTNNSQTLTLLPPPPNISKVKRIKDVFSKYDIDQLFNDKLQMLDQFKIVLLCDDSVSMNTSISKTETRWSNLKKTIEIIYNLSSIFEKNKDGLDLYFLNRSGRCNVKDINIIDGLLKQEPYGKTPLKKKCSQIFKRYQNKKILLIITTDGNPTDDNGNVEINEFIKCLKTRDSNNIYISILSCSDNDNEISYLDKVNKCSNNIYILDNYKENHEYESNLIQYTFGTHITKLFINIFEQNSTKKKHCIIL